MARRHRFNTTALIFLSPTLFLMSIFVVYPFLRALWLSLTRTSLLGGTTAFVGLGNYWSIFEAPDFREYVGNSIIWTLAGVGIQFAFGMTGALLLNQTFRLRGVFRGLIMIPWATPSVLVAMIWLWLLEPNRGPINSLLLNIGVTTSPIPWLAQSSTSLATLIIIDAWHGVPFFAIMLLGALQVVPDELKESARTDGCGAVGVFWHITMPSILPTVLTTVLLRLIWTANTIDLAYVMTGGGPGLSSTTLPLVSYLTAYKQGALGTGAAYAVVQGCVMALPIALYLRLIRRHQG